MPDTDACCRNISTICFNNVILEYTPMYRKFVLALVLLMSLTNVSIVHAQSNDGSDDTIEAFGGNRNGGDC